MSEYAWPIIGVTICVVAVLLFACWLIDRDVQAELDEFDEYTDENPEARFRKVNAEDWNEDQRF